MELKIVIETEGRTPSDKYLYQTEVRLPFVSSFKIIDTEREINFNLSNRTHYINIMNMNDLDYYVEDESLVKVEKYSDKLKVYIPHSINSAFKNMKLMLVNKFTNQKEEFLLNFNPVEVTRETYFLGIIRTSLLIDIMTTVIFIIIIYYLYIHIMQVNLTKKGKEDSSRNANTGKGRSDGKSKSIH